VGRSLAVLAGLLLTLSSAQGQYIRDVPYYHQYFNSINPSGSCQNTTIAITLGLYGVDIHPDELSREYGTEKAQTVAGWEEIFNTQARRFGLAVRDSSRDDASIGDVQRRLDRGLPVPVHGAFTASGHLVVLLGYDEDWYYVHDPAGDWSRNYQLDTPTAGRYARYPRAALERTIEDPLNRYVRMHAIHVEPGPVGGRWLQAPADSLVAGQAQRLQGLLRVRAPGRPRPSIDLSAVGGTVQSLTAIDDSTFRLDAATTPPAAGRGHLDVTIVAGDTAVVLRHPVAVMARRDLPVVADGEEATGWAASFVHNVDVTAQDTLVYAGSTALAFDAASFIWELQPGAPLDLTGYGTLRFAFHPGDAVGGRTPAFSLQANDDPRAIVKLIDGTRPGVDLDQRQWQVVDVPLAAFSWLEQPLTKLRFFGSLRGTFFLDEIRLIADRPFPLDVAVIRGAADSLRLGDEAAIDLAVRVDGALSGRVTADLSDLGGAAQLPLAVGADGLHRLRTTLRVARPSNGLALVRLAIDAEGGASDGGPRRWRRTIEQPVVVVPRDDRLVYVDALDAAWREVESTNVSIDEAHAGTVWRGDHAMAWDAANLIATFETQQAVDPVGYASLRLYMHPGTAQPGRLGALSIMFNRDSRTVYRLLDGALDLERREWQRVDVPLTGRRLEGPIESIRLLGDLTGTFYVDDVRFVAAEISEPVTAVTDVGGARPSDFALGRAYPNPFNSDVVVPFRLDAAGRAELVVYDVLGQPVATLASTWFDAGSHRVTWDGRNAAGRTVASGVYVVRLRADSGQAVTRLLLLR
jgi:hypothetical protein